MSFKHILGHKTGIRILQDAIANDRVAHGYLFSGPGGIGKSMIAKAFVKALNCQGGGREGCDECDSCMKIEAMNHPDVHWISSGLTAPVKIDEIRDIQRAVYLKPYESRWKAFIIDGADNLTEEAANCILKTLEEPPDNTVIIMIAANTNRILKTILSRCQRIMFFGLSREDVEKRLIGLKVDADKAHILSYLSEGSVAKALKMNDDDFLEGVNALADCVLNKVSRPIDEALLSNDDAGVRDSLKESILYIIGLLRDLLFLKCDCADMVVNRHRCDELLKKSRDFSYESIIEKIEESYRLYDLVGKNVNTKIITEFLPI